MTDQNTIILVVILAAVFFGLWVYSSKQKRKFEEARRKRKLELARLKNKARDKQG